MAFRIRKLNHSPQWYDTRLWEKDRQIPAVVAMFKQDISYIGSDLDHDVTLAENVSIYADRWEAILSGRPFRDARGRFDERDLKQDLIEVLERERHSGFRPTDQYKCEPFVSLDKLLRKHELDEETVREFLKWRSRQRAYKKWLAAMEKKKEVKNQKNRDRFNELFGWNKRKR